MVIPQAEDDGSIGEEASSNRARIVAPLAEASFLSVKPAILWVKCFSSIAFVFREMVT
jgi:hypothetical protein